MGVEISDEQDDPLESAWLASLAHAVMEGEGLNADALISISLVDAVEISHLNEVHLGRTGSTDVLAFPIEDLVAGVVPERVAEHPPLLVGDVVICPSVVREHAAAAEVPFDDEMALMVVHGILHLLGYDHEVADDAERMEQRERDLLSAVGRIRP
jgi:probable rRNA maturation factor